MTHIMKIDEFVNENFNSVNDNQIKNFIKTHKVAFDYFVELCKDEENYPEVEDVIDALRSLETNNDITDDEYNFLIANFDAVWSYYLKHSDLDTMNESAMSPMTDEYRIFIIDDDDESVLELSDEKFIELAEQNGTVWSLEGFQDNWNYDSMTMPNPDFSYMRITDKFGKSVKVNDHKYYVYLVDDNDYDDTIEESDIAFTDLAERNGNYWTLASFQDTWNNNAMFMGDPEYSYIRILKK